MSRHKNGACKIIFVHVQLDLTNSCAIREFNFQIENNKIQLFFVFIFSIKENLIKIINMHEKYFLLIYNWRNRNLIHMGGREMWNIINFV